MDEREVKGLVRVVLRLEEIYEPEVISDWLLGTNAHLGHRRPIDVIRNGDVSEVMRAIDAAESGAFA